MRSVKYFLQTREETARFGRTLGRQLKAGDVIALIGDLGAGKTTLTQAIAEGMGITEDVTSPTFTLVQEYDGKVPLFHFDVYRIETANLDEIGFEEYFERGGVVLIEWADRVLSVLPPERLNLILSIGEEEMTSDEDMNPRFLEVIAFGRRYVEIVTECAPIWSGME